MTVSQALENSAIAFNLKYACKFDFTTFDSRVEEFTFLRPNGGWVDVYKNTFKKMYKKSLENSVLRSLENVNAEAMLDDFEYTLIRPYINESGKEIKHKPYVGMDRIARLEYIGQIITSAPQNSVELYTHKYKSGELTLKQMKTEVDPQNPQKEEYVKISAYVQAIETVNQSRSAAWRTFHPLKNNAEKREAALMKKMLSDLALSREEFYREMSAAAYQTFEGYIKANISISQSILRAKEEMMQADKADESSRVLPRADGTPNLA